MKSYGGIQFSENVNLENLILPRYTSSEMGILVKSIGEMVYQTDGETGPKFWNGTAWIKFSDNVFSDSYELKSNKNTSNGYVGLSSGKFNKDYIPNIDHLTFNTTSGNGITFGNNSTYGYKDLLGDLSARSTGVTAPVLAIFKNNVRSWFYDVNRQADIVYHIPHDYVPNSDIFLHIHWSHNGTAISGQLGLSYRIIYADGHNQEPFGNEIVINHTISTPNISTIPQYMHRVDEIQITGSGLLDKSLIEIDGLIMVNMVVTSIPLITGSVSQNLPAFFTLDCHMLSTGIGSKNKDKSSGSFYI